MAEALTISKTRNNLPPYVDFARLREEGIQHLEKLSTALWTDFNLHDPGITFLELLCYAITDLGYRNAFDTSKLLARSPEQRSEADSNFFSAAEILTCNPVTLLDYRKLLLDVAGVRNAWLEPAMAGESEVPVYIDTQSKALTYDRPSATAMRLPLRGLYRVKLELDPETVRDACGQEYLSTSRIVAEVQRVLHQHRNLAEDFLSIDVLNEEEIAVCADLELDSAADPEEVLTEIYLKLDAFLSPRLTYHRLQDLLARGKTPEEIFAGRPFRYHPLHLEELLNSDPACPPDAFDLRPYHPDSFGFIDTDELEALPRRTVLHASDFYQLILDVPGVKAVKKLSLLNYLHGLPQSQGDSWCLHVSEGHTPVLSLEHARITFYKQNLPFKANEALVQQQFLERKVAHTKAKRARHELDLVLPPGEFVDLKDYPSIQKDLPQVYGVGEAGLPQSAPPERQAQAKQLKAYLTFFDQILADYLAQLAHVRDLFSMEKECRREQNGRRHTYFTQGLTDLPGVADIVRNYRSCDSALAGEEAPIDYLPYLQHISESEEQYLTRRNRFLDHLLARFSEDFTDYVLLMYQLRGKGEQQRGIIQDKIDFLRNYPQLSRDRGKAFDYAQPGHTWDTNNVSGFKQRVAKLLGMDDATRRHLSHAHVVKVETGYQWELWQEGGLALRSVPRYPSEEAARQAFATAWTQAADATAYFRYRQGEEFGFELCDVAGEPLAVHPQPYDSPEEREAARWQLIAWVRSNGVPLQVEAATECFFYEIYRRTDDSPWLRAIQGHQTQSAAQDAWESDLMLAENLSHFEKIDLAEEESFAFRLIDAEANELARSVPIYATAAERDLRRRELFYCLNQARALCHTPGTPGTFRFALMSPDGETVWLESVRTFNRVQAARAAFNRFLPLAGSRVYYHLIDEAEGDLPYSFEVWNRQGEVIATHPQGYATACERDLVIDTLLHFLSKELCLKHEADEAGQWRFWVEDEEATRLLEGIETFPQKAEAQAALRQLVDLASDDTHYRKIDDLEGDCPFGFVLQSEGKDVATHPRSYAKAAERDRAIESLRWYFSDTHPACELTGEPGRYRFWWGEPETSDAPDVPLLLSLRDDYPDPDEARAACEELGQQARDPQRYARFTLEDGSFSFELQNEAGEGVARHASLDEPETPLAYATEAERDAMIDLIMGLAGRTACAQRIINPEGAFFPTLRDEAGQILWIGTQVAPSVAAAEAQGGAIRELALEEGNYQPLDDLGQPCPYGFALIDEGQTVARHPRQYGSPEARDQAIAELQRYLDAPRQAREITPAADSGWQVNLLGASGSSLMRLAGTFASQAEAQQAYAAAIEAADGAPLVMAGQDEVPFGQAHFLLSYANDRCRFTFTLHSADGLALAQTPWPGWFDSRQLMHDSLTEIQWIAREKPVPVEVRGRSCGYYVHLPLSEGGGTEGERISSLHRYPAESWAWQAAADLAPLLRDSSRWAADQPEPGHLRLTGPEGQPLMEGVSSFTASDLLGWLEGVDARATQPELSRLPAAYYAELRREADGAVLLRGNEQGTESQAWEQANQLCERVLDAVARDDTENKDKFQFQVVSSEACAAHTRLRLVFQEEKKKRNKEQKEPKDKWEQSQYQVVAYHPLWLPSVESSEALEAEIRHLANDEGFHVLEHLLLRPRSRGMARTWYVAWQQEAGEHGPGWHLQTSVSESSYEEAEAIRQALLDDLAEMATGIITLDPEKGGSQCYTFVWRNAAGDTVFENQTAYADAEERAKAVQQLIAAAQAVQGDEAQEGGPTVASYQAADDPRLVPDGFLPIQVEAESGNEAGAPCLTGVDPYSFRLTVIFPYWPSRFRENNLAFRRFCERSIRLEAPAHLAVKICWLDAWQMRAFENKYRRWLAQQALAASSYEPCERSDALNDFLAFLPTMKSRYPQATLHDCQESGPDDNPLILNSTSLGTANH